MFLFDSLRIFPYENYTLNMSMSMKSLKVEATNPMMIKVTLGWYDPPHPIGFSRRLLIHDLDVYVITPCNEVIRGNEHIFQHDVELNVFNKDVSNNIEQVTINMRDCLKEKTIGDNDEIVTYQIVVQSFALPYNVSQEFALILTTPGKR